MPIAIDSSSHAPLVPELFQPLKYQLNVPLLHRQRRPDEYCVSPEERSSLALKLYN